MRVQKQARTATAALALAGAMVLGGGVAALAGHQFTDVSNTHAFHDEISEVADAGITTGFPDGSFRPTESVSRQALAAFVARAGGRVAFDAQLPLEIGNASGLDEVAVIAEVEAAPGATGSGGGYFLINGSATAVTEDVGSCPCELAIGLVDGEGIMNVTYVDLAGAATETGWANANGALQWVVPVAADTSDVYSLVVLVDDDDVDSVTVYGELTATYVPFLAGGPSASASGSDASAAALADPRFSSAVADRMLQAVLGTR